METIKRFEHLIFYCPVCKEYVKPEVSEKEVISVFCKVCNTMFARIRIIKQ